MHGLKLLFLYDTEEEKALFDQLNFAYMGGPDSYGDRNQEEFPVTQAKIDFWRQEVVRPRRMELTERLRRSFHRRPKLLVKNLAKE